MIKLVKISNKDNLKIYWTKDRFEELLASFGDVQIMKTGAIMINKGKNKVYWLDPFNPMVLFIPFQSFGKHLKKAYHYTAPELVSQLMYGDRNLAPYDADTNEPCSYHNLSDGYRAHSSWSSHNKEVQRMRTKDPIEHAKMRINGAYNYALSIAKTVSTMYFYIATLKDSLDIKFGITKYSDLDKRRNFGHDEFDGTNYDKAVILASGNSFDICRMERDYKMLHLNATERINVSQCPELIEFIANYSQNITIYNVDDFICR